MEALYHLNPMTVESAIAKCESHQSILEAHTRIQEHLEDARGHFRVPPNAMTMAAALVIAEMEAHTHIKSFFRGSRVEMWLLTLVHLSSARRAMPREGVGCLSLEM